MNGYCIEDCSMRDARDIGCSFAVLCGAFVLQLERTPYAQQARHHHISLSVATGRTCAHVCHYPILPEADRLRDYSCGCLLSSARASFEVEQAAGRQVRTAFDIVAAHTVRRAKFHHRHTGSE